MRPSRVLLRPFEIPNFGTYLLLVYQSWILIRPSKLFDFVYYAFLIIKIVFKLFVYRYKVEVAGKSLPVLTNLDKGRYGVLVFENLNKYLQMDKWNRELLDKYCREYSVGIVGFAPPGEESLVGAQLKGFPLFIHTNLRLKVRHFSIHFL